MCDAEKSVRGWLDGLMPKIIAGLGTGFDVVQYELSVPGDSFFMSSIYYVTVRCNNGADNHQEKTFHLVVKRPPQMDDIRELIRSDSQFYNEILFYRNYAEPGTDYPFCVYSDNTSTSALLIVLENVRQQGYDLCPQKYNPPMEYTLAAMREIGRFHARGYVMKEKQREKFFELVQRIQEVRYERIPGNRFEDFTNLMSTRSVEYLRCKGYDNVFCDKMETFLEKAFDNVMMKSVEPVEPLATLCHGDFTLNNTMFKREYNSKDKSVGLKAMLIDFALMRYGSPAIDLSTYLCLHYPKLVQKDRFKDVFQVYYDSLKEYLTEHGIIDDRNYSYEALYNDYKERGLFGFVIASFYLTIVMGIEGLPPENMTKMDIKEAAMICRKVGGDEVSKILADMLLDLKEFGSLDHII